MRELVLLCVESEAERLSDLLLDIGVLSVSVEDADHATDNEHPLFGEPGSEPEVLAWYRNIVVALLPDELEPETVLNRLEAQTGHDYRIDAQVRVVADEDWVRVTQAQFEPIQVTDRLWIVPSWHKDSPVMLDAHQTKDVFRIELDPGLAFGTGSHPTTHLCAQWLAEHTQAGMSMLDYGTGSGILAIITQKLGAKEVIGVDIDKQAVQAAQYNAEVNRVAIDFMLPDELSTGQFDVVVANILSNPLKVLAPMLSARVKAGGHLILSGVLKRQTQEVAAVYEPYIKLDVWRDKEGWVCLHGQK